ncbi:MAG: tol-pal system protein YbgF [Deltaproteobacteria bacterium]|nr:tol-pal system protein YbgF [Deltaproteobacteria bacterium]
MRAKNRIKQTLAVLSALAACIAASGCGPGFPIMTKEQEALVTNVDRLVKENDALKARLAALEAQEGGSDVKNDVDALRQKVAGVNNEMDKLRQEFSFVQGAVESDDYSKTEAKDAVRSVSASLAQMNDKVASLETRIKDVEAKTAALKDAAEAKEKAQAQAQMAQAGAEAAAQDAKPAQPPADDLYAKGYKAAIDKRLDEAQESLAAFLASYPDHKLASNAQYWLGEVYYAKGDFERAVLEFDKVVKKYPKAEKTAAAMLKEGYSFEKLGSVKEARVLLEDVVERFPKSTEAKLAKERLKALK